MRRFGWVLPLSLINLVLKLLINFDGICHFETDVCKQLYKLLLIDLKVPIVKRVPRSYRGGLRSGLPSLPTPLVLLVVFFRSRGCAGKVILHELTNTDFSPLLGSS